MKPISQEIVEKTWQAVGAMDSSEAQRAISALGEQQPVLLAYLMAAEEDNFNEEERGIFMYMGFVLWRMMSRGNSKLEPVTEDLLVEAEANNLKMIEYLEGETEADFAVTVETLSNSYNQREVLKYVVEALMEGSEEGQVFREENKGLSMLHLKTVIDCMDR